MFTVLTYAVNDVNIDSPDTGAAGVSRLIFWEGADCGFLKFRSNNDYIAAQQCLSR